ncbi:endo-1,4-beta-xylanase [Rhodopirellula sallentina]|uniref:Beta-xylanase n=1 Tax=Rhodopirellula sallentina SM41 TaxID=1263870 RepID=M5U479_9BACT|nr:endo-1,4-beta-xylanase [Rhodopirellula sallentina]EMI52671.1 glycoside hydrolase family protein [Rhodopirellula sallentina SM41]
MHTTRHLIWGNQSDSATDIPTVGSTGTTRTTVLLTMATLAALMVWLLIGEAAMAGSQEGDMPLVRLHAEVSQTTEASGFAFPARVALIRSGNTSEPLAVRLSIEGTATNGDDYERLSPIVKFSSGQEFQYVRIQPIEDDRLEGPETIVLRLLPNTENDLRESGGLTPEIENGATYRLGAPSSREVTITIAGEVTERQRGEAFVFGQKARAPQWTGDSQSHRRTRVDGIGLPFALVDRVSVVGAENPWDDSLSWPLESSVEKGDEVLVSLFARVMEDSTGEQSGNAEGKLTVRLQHDQAPYVGIEETFTVGETWQPLLLRTRLSDAIPAGESSLSVRVGYGRQTLEIAGFQFWNFGKERHPFLPQGIFSYEGREADASWRSGVAERIRQTRSESVRFYVDTPPGAERSYRYRLKKAEYEIGTAVNSRWVAATAGEMWASEDAKKYRSVVKKYFDRVTDENAQQWAAWEQNPKRAIETAEWAIDNGLTLRGHSVLWGDPVDWPSPPDLWKDYQEILVTRGGGVRVGMMEMRRRVAAHIRQNALVALSGSIEGTDDPIIAQWDVLNHPILHDEMWEITGWEFLRAAIREVRTLAHPKTELFVNEDQVLSLPGHPNARPLHELISDFLDAGLPIDGVGFQCHFKSERLPSIASIESTIRRFTGLGLKLHVTEFDIDDQHIDRQTQADFTRDFLELIASEPSFTSTTVWGFWEGEHWRSEEGTAMWDQQWNLLPHGQVLIDHLDRDWKPLRFRPVSSESAGAEKLPADATAVATQTLRRGNYEVDELDALGRVRKSWLITVTPTDTRFELMSR